MNKSGITLVELLVVVSIVGILAVVLGLTYEGWQGRYNIEGEIKQIQADLMNARASAMARQRDFFVSFNCSGASCTSYSVYEDYPLPDGNGIFDTAEDHLLGGYPKTLAYPVAYWTGSALAAVSTVTFDDRGLITPNSGAIVVTSSTDASKTENPDSDCITFTDLKMNMGQWNVTSAACTIK